MLWVKSGEFIAGGKPLSSKESDELAEWNEDRMLWYNNEAPTIISQGFWLGQYVVTQAHWQAFQKDILKTIPIREIKDSPDFPMYGITWLEGMLFCRALNIRYKESLPDGYHFSLPTEIQWEYACKADQKEDYLNLTLRDYEDMYKFEKIQKVGQKGVNSWGFYDMLGNIREVCYDISTYAAGIPSEETVPIAMQGDKTIDWIGNLDEEQWFPDLPGIGVTRVIRGLHTSFGREWFTKLRLLQWSCWVKTMSTTDFWLPPL